MKPGWLRLDPYILALMATIVVASLLPATGAAAVALGWTAKVVVALVFFLHGAKLSREALVAGLIHWRLHLAVLAISFVLFPVLGLGAGLLPSSVLPAGLAMGVLFLCCLPSTVQSSINFTAIARGNVAAAVCAASASNILGMVLTPVLVGALMHVSGAGPDFGILRDIALQLFAPFLAGQIARPWLKGLIERHGKAVGMIDRGSILLIVYAAFGRAVVEGVWTRVSPVQLLIVGAICLIILLIVLAVTDRAGRWMRLPVEDRVVLIFCGSKKSLVTGAPMAAILFAPAEAGLMILPLMIFHQMQLIACALLAQKFGEHPEPSATTNPGPEARDGA